MRVCLTNPPWSTNKQSGIRSGCRVPNLMGHGELTFMPYPFLLTYAHSTLERDGFECRTVDAIGEELDEEAFAQRVLGFEPDLIIVETSTSSYGVDLEIIRNLRSKTTAKIAVCGPHASAVPVEILKDQEIDFVMMGEIEGTAPALAKALKTNSSLREVNGIAFRADDGKACVNPRRALVTLDDLPWPHRDTMPMKAYRVAGYPPPTLFMYATRGCPYQCTFCLWPQTIYEYGSYRTRDVANVADEIEMAFEKYGPYKSVYFDDDTFNIGKPRMMAWADELEKRKLKFKWGCNARADLFDKEMMERLASVGMFNIRIGIESADPEVLARTKKNLNLEAVRNCLVLARKVGVKVHVTFTIGLSGESRESIQKTVDFARTLCPDSIAFTTTTPYPGTRLFDEVEKDGLLLTRDWSKYNVNGKPVVRTKTLTAEELNDEARRAIRKIYLTPHFLIRRMRYAMSAGEFGSLLLKGSRRLLLGRS